MGSSDRATGWGAFWRGRWLAVLTTGELGVNWKEKRGSKSFTRSAERGLCGFSRKQGVGVGCLLRMQTKSVHGGELPLSLYARL